MDFDAPAQYDRDLRGACQDSKRHKDFMRKWHYGENPHPGVGWDSDANTPKGGSNEAHRMKIRPVQPTRMGARNPWKKHHNIVKPDRSGANQFVSMTQVRSRIGILEEIDAAAKGGEGDLQMMGRWAVQEDPFMYSFDKSATTPGQPLTLDVFVKQPTARDTERLVEKEYEVVDENGRELRGREAKRNLRKGGSGSGLGEKEVEDGFELV